MPWEGPGVPLSLSLDPQMPLQQAEEDWGQERRSMEGDCPVKDRGEDSADRAGLVAALPHGASVCLSAKWA